MSQVMPALTLAGGMLLVAASCGKNDASADKIGIQECDDYIAKYSACIAKMPAAMKGPAEQSLKLLKDGWKQSATTSQDMTKAACKSGLDTLANNPICK